MPRLIRRAPLWERIKDMLNPLDFLLWLSEQIDANDWEQFHRAYSTTIGVTLNIVFLIARANSGRKAARRDALDDLFGDEFDDGRIAWLGWLASFFVQLLTLFSLMNALYTFRRRRHYRLFESSVDVAPATPSAHRVRVDSSPVSSSPLRFLSSVLGAAVGTGAGASAAEARAHPDPTRDVWELAVWDPLPLCLRLFCLFSPGHVLVYWLFLPVSSSSGSGSGIGGSASVTVLTAMLLAALLSAQLLLLQASFSQQNKDTALIHKEVLNEYDTKFVHPRTQSTVRDVGTQFDGDPELLLAPLDAAGQEQAPGQAQDKTGRLHNRRPHHPNRQDQQQQRRPLNFVHTYTPTTVLHRPFITHANPNYAKHYDPDGYAEQLARSRHGGHAAAGTSAAGGAGATTSAAFQRRAASPYDMSSPFRRVTSGAGGVTTSTTTTTTTTAAAATYATNGASTGDGGSLGVYSHANSPFRKAAASAAPQSQQNGGNSRSIPFPLASQYGRPAGTAVSLSSSTPIAPAATKNHYQHFNRHREGSPLKNSFL